MSSWNKILSILLNMHSRFRNQLNMSGENEYPCERDGCKRVYRSIGGRAKHYKKCSFPIINLKGYEKMDNNKVKCLRCDLVLSNVTNYYRHFKNVHTEKEKEKIKVKKSYICNVCSKECPSESKLVRHKNTHQRVCSYQCQYCRKFYTRRNYYDDHLTKCKNAPVGVRSSALLDVTNMPSVNPSTSNFPSMLDIGNSSDAQDDFDGEMVSMADDDIGTNSMNMYSVPVVCVVGATGDFDGDMVSVPGQDVGSRLNVTDVSESVIGGSGEAVGKGNVEVVSNVDSIVPVGKNVHGSTQRKRSQRNRERLMSVVSRLNGIPENDQKLIVRKSLESTKTGIDNMLTTSTADTIAEARFGCGILQYLKSVDCQNIEKRNLFASLLYSVYGEQILDDDNTTLLNWLSKQLDKKPCRIKTIICNYVTCDGKKYKDVTNFRLPLDVRQCIFDTWNKNSIVTVDRRNGRDVKTITEDEFEEKFSDLLMPNECNLEHFVSNRNQKMIKCTKRIATKTVREIWNEVRTLMKRNVASGSIFNNMPFYIEKPTEREKESCLCKFCHNLRLRFDTSK